MPQSWVDASDILSDPESREQLAGQVLLADGPVEIKPVFHAAYLENGAEESEDDIAQLSIATLNLPQGTTLDEYAASTVLSWDKPKENTVESREKVQLAGGDAEKWTGTLEDQNGVFYASNYVIKNGDKGFLLRMTVNADVADNYKSLFDKIARSFTFVD